MKFKKIVVVLILIIILTQSLCYAAGGELSMTPGQFDALMNNPTEVSIAASGGSATTMLVKVVYIFFAILKAIVDIVFVGIGAVGGVLNFTIESLLFSTNPNSFTDINFFVVDNNTNAIINILKTNVAGWYVAIRNVSTAALLCVLVYVGIRMALSTTASQEAKYKKMITDWVTSFVILFVLQYIMIACIYANYQVVNIVKVGKQAIMERQVEKLQNQIASGTTLFTTVKSVEDRIAQIVESESKDGILENAINAMLTNNILYGSVSDKITSVILIIMLIYYTIKFFIIYIKRFFVIGFLIVISPLVTITYAIDKVGDGEAQAFNTLLKEFMVNVFIQPIHALLYLIFIYTALFLAGKAPLIAIFFFAVLSKGEKFARTIFFQKLEGKTVKNMGDEKVRDIVKVS